MNGGILYLKYEDKERICIYAGVIKKSVNRGVAKWDEK